MEQAEQGGAHMPQQGDDKHPGNNFCIHGSRNAGSFRNRFPEKQPGPRGKHYAGCQHGIEKSCFDRSLFKIAKLWRIIAHNGKKHTKCTEDSKKYYAAQEISQNRFFIFYHKERLPHANQFFTYYIE